MTAIHPRTDVTEAQIAQFCRTWNIVRLELFGSILGDDFGGESDVDLLVVFAPDAHPTMFSLVRMEDELTAMFGRKADLVERQAIEQSPNWIRRQSVLASTQLIYDEAVLQVTGH